MTGCHNFIIFCALLVYYILMTEMPLLNNVNAKDWFGVRRHMFRTKNKEIP